MFAYYPSEIDDPEPDLTRFFFYILVFKYSWLLLYSGWPATNSPASGPKKPSKLPVSGFFLESESYGNLYDFKYKVECLWARAFQLGKATSNKVSYLPLYRGSRK